MDEARLRDEHISTGMQHMMPVPDRYILTEDLHPLRQEVPATTIQAHHPAPIQIGIRAEEHLHLQVTVTEATTAEAPQAAGHMIRAGLHHQAAADRTIQADLHLTAVDVRHRQEDLLTAEAAEVADHHQEVEAVAAVAADKLREVYQENSKLKI